MLNADLDAGVEGTQLGTEGLAPLVPQPRVNLTRFRGVFAPLCRCKSKHGALVTPARRGRGSKPKATDEGQEQTPAERR